MALWALCCIKLMMMKMLAKINIDDTIDYNDDTDGDKHSDWHVGEFEENYNSDSDEYSDLDCDK